MRTEMKSAQDVIHQVLRETSESVDPRELSALIIEALYDEFASCDCGVSHLGGHDRGCSSMAGGVWVPLEGQGGTLSC